MYRKVSFLIFLFLLLGIVSNAADADYIAKAKKNFKQLCDWLCERQKDGRFSGISFQDQRAVRGLLAGYKIFGEKKYLEASIEWGEVMMAEQRDDGGYRMGYGVKEDGQEACYVADGGESCIGMITLYSYAEGAFKARLRKSVENYMRYRAGFRNEDGGIGIGWTFKDHLVKPPVRKDKVFREKRHLPFTIGCTLASASAYAAITKDDNDIDLAVKDTRRFMKEVTSMVGGASVESLCWAHHYLKDQSLRAEIEAYMKKRWLPYITKPTRKWWLEGGGRKVLGLDSLAYYYSSAEKDHKVQATIVRATKAICGRSLPAGLEALMAKPSLTRSEWRYLCFAAVSLGDVVRPNVSLREF